MKKYLVLLTTLVLSATSLIAETPPSTLPVKREPTHKDEYDIGRRLPSRPIMCTIDFNSQTIVGIDDEIFLYEVHDSESENLISSFTEASDFTSFLEHSNGCYMIRFTSESYHYIGYISM